MGVREKEKKKNSHKISNEAPHKLGAKYNQATWHHKSYSHHQVQDFIKLSNLINSHLIKIILIF